VLRPIDLISGPSNILLDKRLGYAVDRLMNVETSQSEEPKEHGETMRSALCNVRPPSGPYSRAVGRAPSLSPVSREPRQLGRISFWNAIECLLLLFEKNLRTVRVLLLFYGPRVFDVPIHRSHLSTNCRRETSPDSVQKHHILAISLSAAPNAQLQFQCCDTVPRLICPISSSLLFLLFLLLFLWNRL
jgi:hypothetical protein